MKKKKKRTMWTIQFIPHGQGTTKSLNTKIFPYVLVFSFILVLTAAGLAATYFLYQTKLTLDERLEVQKTEMDEFVTENRDLKQKINTLNRELVVLHNEVMELQNFIEEVQLLEQQIKELDGTSYQPPEQEQGPQIKSMLSIASYDIEPEQQQQTTSRTEELRNKIQDLMVEAEVQQEKLTSLKEEIEEAQYQALFVPAIPPSNGRLTSNFGWRRDPFNGSRRMHEGIDFASYFRSPVYATAHGTVTYASRNGGYGNHVEISHGNGYKTTYSHLSIIEVKKGEEVERGDVIGRMGSTGRSTGVHLHYEIHKNGKPVNPAPYLKGGSDHVVQKTTTNR